VTTLPAEQLGQIYANLNFDMVGSPNYVRFVYDGDGSATEAPGPSGSCCRTHSPKSRRAPTYRNAMRR
jgi:Zn-dependent M28 family amino/carboxypeptidase